MQQSLQEGAMLVAEGCSLLEAIGLQASLDFIPQCLVRLRSRLTPQSVEGFAGIVSCIPEPAIVWFQDIHRRQQSLQRIYRSLVVGQAVDGIDDELGVRYG